MISSYDMRSCEPSSFLVIHQHVCSYVHCERISALKISCVRKLRHITGSPSRNMGNLWRSWLLNNNVNGGTKRVSMTFQISYSCCKLNIYHGNNFRIYVFYLTKNMWDLTEVPVCICTENMLFFTITSKPELFRRVHVEHSEFWQDSVALLANRTTQARG